MSNCEIPWPSPMETPTDQPAPVTTSPTTAPPTTTAPTAPPTTSPATTTPVETIGASLSGMVWLDNGDHVRSEDEDLLDGLQLNLINTADESIIVTTTTDTGRYEFSGLAPGTYRVEFELVA